MPDGDLQCDARAVAEAEEIGLRDLQLPQQPRDIVGRTLERDRLIAIGRASMTLLVECDDAAVRARNGSTRPKFESIVEPPP